MAQNESKISAEFPFKSHYVKVLDSQLHYIDEGKGDPILFLHGFPEWSYLWRNIIPQLKTKGRCIALDMIGFGKSDKPSIEYRVFDHIRYLEAFIEALQLKNITLVMHGWGSVIGFDYARRHEKNVKAIAFSESFLEPPVSKDMVSLPVLEMSSIRQTSDRGKDAIMNKNYYINVALPSIALRKLSKEEITQYQSPFLKPESCKPLWQYANEFPLGDGQPKEVLELMKKNAEWLQKTHVPKLLMYAVPGYLTTIATVQWARDNLPNIKLTDVGDALHYPQETDPKLFSDELLDWYQAIKKS